jgi:O-antigen/teichoic acid export membrane protein
VTGLSTIARNTAFQAGGDLLSKIASLAFYVVMARQLGSAGFGDFMFALSLTILLTSLAGFGTDSLLTRLVAQDREALHRLFWNAVALKLVLGTVLAGTALLVAVLGDYSPAVQATVAVLGAASIAELVAKSIAATFLAYDDLRPVAAGLILQRFSTAGAGIAALLSGAGIVTVSVIYLAGSLLGLLYVVRALARMDIRPRREVSFARARRVAADAAPYGMKLIFTTVIFRVDATILSLMKGAEATGLYSAAYRALESTLFVAYALEAALFPTFARLRRTSTPTLGEMFEIGQKLVVAIMAPAGMAFLLYGREILELLYGAEFAAGATAMQWLGGATALYGVSLMSGSVLLAGGRAKVMAWATGAIMVENIVLNLIFIPAYSLEGAAAVTTVTEVTQAVVYTAFALQLTGRVSARRILAGPVAGCAAMAAMALALPGDLAFVAAALIAYAAAVVLCERILYPADLARVTGVVRRRLGRA